MLLSKRPGCPNNVYLMQKVTSKGSILMTGIQRNRITRIPLRKVTSRVFQKKGVSVLRISGKSVVIFCGNLRLVHLKQNLWYLSASFSCIRMYFFYRFVINRSFAIWNLFIAAQFLTEQDTSKQEVWEILIALSALALDIVWISWILIRCGWLVRSIRSR